jgi:uncharacterized membrane protein YjgN (DUF898 family)
MDDSNSDVKSYRLNFDGNGSEYFGVIIINWLLTILTLGIYYPWAKAKQLRFIYGSVALNDDRFAFLGTGKEMFKGFIKAILLFGILFLLLFLLSYFKLPAIGLLIFYAGLIAIMPVAIHGSYRYRMSRTSWRGIRFGYRGNRTELIKKFFKWVFFTIITFGIYSAWMVINLRSYVMGKVRFGNIEVKYKADGGEYFVINLIGYLLTLLTLGIYFFWWQKNLFAYYIDNLSLHNDGQEIKLKSTATGGGFFKLMVVNLLIIIITLGLGYAWVVTRTLKYFVSCIHLSGNIDLDAITQTEDNFTDATGEDINDFLNLDFII